jgi:hypothetical protein
MSGAASLTAPINRSHWLPRPRFSLRSFLLAFTAFAIGFPLWYRWPYQAARVPSKEQRHDQYCGTPYFPDADHDYSRVEGTYRRTWGGPPVEHGRIRKFDRRGDLAIEQSFRDGIKHGPCREYSGGIVSRWGQYQGGLKAGRWTSRRDSSWLRKESWQSGCLEGETIFEAPGVERRVTFESDRVIAVDGQPIQPAIQQLLADATHDDRLSHALLASMFLEFDEASLRDVAVFLEACAGIPIQLDDQVDGNLRVTEWWDDLQLAEALLILCHPRGLTPICQNGGIRITVATSKE